MKPKNTFLITALSLGIAGLLSSQASAATIGWHDSYQSYEGGEFTLMGTGLDLSAYTGLNTKAVLGDDSFQTFCIEYNEHIYRNSEVIVGLSDSAMLGGISGGSPKDPISLGTAYLYSRFASGDLAGDGFKYALADGREASARLLQEAIWYLEGERTLAQIGGGNIFVTLVKNEYDDPFANAAGAFNVQAVNLTSPAGSLRQDQLYVGPGASLVPDGGASVMLLGFALGGIGVIRALAGKKAQG